MREKVRGLVITGFMGTGKTSVGRSVSRKLKMEFVDLDAEIEKEAGMKTVHIFSKIGEPAFRDMESKMLGKVLKVPGRVVSTGGGTILDPQNLKLMKSYGMVICLWASPAKVQERLEACEDRPLVKGENKLAKISELLEKRKAHYLSADISVQTDGKSIEEISEEIASHWREAVDR